MYIDNLLWYNNFIKRKKEWFELSKKQKTQMTQVNISIPTDWKNQLEKLARIYSVEEDQTLTFLDLMRRAINEKYQLDDTDE